MLWNSTKAKVQLRLSVQRLRTLQHKKEAQAKANRRDIATLMEKGRLETARIKVESIIHEDIHTELLELLELYCELLLARFGLLEPNGRELDSGIAEGVCSIILAAPRTEVKELHILREILMHKYGRDFSLAVMENRDERIPNRIMSKLVAGTPQSKLVDAYLAEIAKAYGVQCSGIGKKELAGTDEEKSTEDPNNSVESDEKIESKPQTENSVLQTDSPSKRDKPNGSPTPADDFEALAQRFAALKKR